MQKIECCNKGMDNIHQCCYEGSYCYYYTIIYWCSICGTYKEFENQMLKKEKRPKNVST